MHICNDVVVKCHWATVCKTVRPNGSAYAVEPLSVLSVCLSVGL